MAFESREVFMIILIDVDYREKAAKGHAAGLLSETPFESQADRIITAVVEDVDAYQPGQFYRRELKCIDEVLKKTDIGEIEIIFIDGYADFGTDKLPLGAYVYKEYQIPVIGIAKNPFKGCVLKDTEVLRGNSSKPLYVTCQGVEIARAKDIVRNMAGDYRLPDLVKITDHAARDWES